MDTNERQPELTELRRLQLSELDILMEFRRLCEENHLRYYLTAGTLLGAVRHRGFIPWDDDVDVVMPREDYDRLPALCRQLSPGYYLQNEETEPNYPYFFSKIRKENTEVFEPCLAGVDIRKGHYIDVFPLDGCPAFPPAARLFFKWIWLLTWAGQGKVDAAFSCGYTKPGARLAYRILTRLPLPFLRRLRRSACRPAAGSKRLCTVGGAHGYPAETYDPVWFRESTELPFEGTRFPAPGGWHELLTNMYGDYRKPPEEADRQGHFGTERK